jgi:hypothetical protein
MKKMGTQIQNDRKPAKSGENDYLFRLCLLKRIGR